MPVNIRDNLMAPSYGSINATFYKFIHVTNAILRIVGILEDKDSWKDGLFPDHIFNKLKGKHGDDFFLKLSDSISRVIQGLQFAARLPLNASMNDITQKYIDTLDINSILESMSCMAEMSGDLSNSVLWRHRPFKDRMLSVVNRDLKEEFRLKIKESLNNINAQFSSLYNTCFTSGINDSVFGFVKYKNIKQNAQRHIYISRRGTPTSFAPESLINCDISKFFHSTTLDNVIAHNQFYDGFLSNFLYKVFKTYSPSLLNTNELQQKYVLYIMAVLKSAAFFNFVFINLMSFLMHNGRLPTGAPYSPTIANLLFRKADLNIIAEITKHSHSFSSHPGIVYTRYADDITISAKSAVVDGKYTLDMDFLKKIEAIINNHGYFLKYEKTKISGKGDAKTVTGITINSGSASLSSNKKKEFADILKTQEHLSTSDRGKLEWLKSVNTNQYAYVYSNYLFNKVEKLEHVNDKIMSLLVIRDMCFTHFGRAIHIADLQLSRLNESHYMVCNKGLNCVFSELDVYINMKKLLPKYVMSGLTMNRIKSECKSRGMAL